MHPRPVLDGVAVAPVAADAVLRYPDLGHEGLTESWSVPAFDELAVLPVLVHEILRVRLGRATAGVRERRLVRVRQVAGRFLGQLGMPSPDRCSDSSSTATFRAATHTGL